MLCIVVVSVQLATMFLGQRQPSASGSASTSASWHDVCLLLAAICNTHTCIYLTLLLIICLYRSLPRRRLFLLCLLASFYPSPTSPQAPPPPTAIPSWPKCMVMPAMPAMLMLILRRVSSNGVVDVPLRQPFGDFVVIILAAFRAEAAAPWLPGSMVPWFLC